MRTLTLRCVYPDSEGSGSYPIICHDRASVSHVLQSHDVVEAIRMVDGRMWTVGAKGRFSPMPGNAFENPPAEGDWPVPF